MDVRCLSCGWIGSYNETNSGFCPMCSQQIPLNIVKINSLTLI